MLTSLKQVGELLVIVGVPVQMLKAFYISILPVTTAAGFAYEAGVLGVLYLGLDVRQAVFFWGVSS